MDIEKVKKLRLDAPDAGNPSTSAPTSGMKWVTLLALVGLIAFAAGWFLRSASMSDADGLRDSSTAAEAPTRENRPIASRNATPVRAFTAAGYIEPSPPYPVNVTPLVAGRLELFAMLEGTVVEKDQMIARLDRTALERRARELEAAASVKAARIEHARTVAARAAGLADIGAAPRRELEAARAELATLAAEGHRLEEERATMRWQIENTTIRAPVAGVIFERLAHSGQWVGPGHESAIASLYDPAQLQVWVDVNQRDAGRVRVGQRADVSLDAEPGRSFAGRVDRILPRASIAKNTFQAKIALEETSPSLRPDMSVMVTFLAETASATEENRE